MTSSSGPPPPCIITGDFNLTPDSPVYEFLTSGFLKFAGLSSRFLSFTFSHGGQKLGNSLLPSQLGITDQCQHADRTNSCLFNSETAENQKSYVNKEKSHLFGNGAFSHSLGLRSAYKHYNNRVRRCLLNTCWSECLLYVRAYF